MSKKITKPISKNYGMKIITVMKPAMANYYLWRQLKEENRNDVAELAAAAGQKLT